MTDSYTIAGDKVSPIHLEISARNSLASVVRFFIHAAIMDAGFEQTFADEVELALDEGLANIVEHTYKDDGVGKIVVDLSFRAGEITLALRHFGIGYDPTRNPDVDMDEYMEKNSVGGLGVHMIRKLMDDVEYLDEGERGKVLVMKKRLQA